MALNRAGESSLDFTVEILCTHLATKICRNLEFRHTEKLKAEYERRRIEHHKRNRNQQIFSNYIVPTVQNTWHAQHKDITSTNEHAFYDSTVSPQLISTSSYHFTGYQVIDTKFHVPNQRIRSFKPHSSSEQTVPLTSDYPYRSHDFVTKSPSLLSTTARTSVWLEKSSFVTPSPMFEKVKINEVPQKERNFMVTREKKPGESVLSSYSMTKTSGTYEGIFKKAKATDEVSAGSSGPSEGKSNLYRRMHRLRRPHHRHKIQGNSDENWRHSELDTEGSKNMTLGNSVLKIDAVSTAALRPHVTHPTAQVRATVNRYNLPVDFTTKLPPATSEIPKSCEHYKQKHPWGGKRLKYQKEWQPWDPDYSDEPWTSWYTYKSVGNTGRKRLRRIR